MKVVAVFMMLAVAAMAKPKPCGFRCGGGFGFPQGGSATGFGSGQVIHGQTSNPYGGTSQLAHINAQAGGSAHGSGASFNSGNAFSNQQTGPYGSFQNGGASGTSNQFGGFSHFGK